MKDFVLLDTDVCSFLLKKDSRAAYYAGYIVGRLPAISFVTVAELYQWMFLRKWAPSRIAAMEDALRKYLVIPFNRDLCKLWAQVSYQCRQSGHEIKANDAWIAATALLYRIPLITHNRRDFRDIPSLTVISQMPGEN